jgi:squalene-hopene/tetraprenyl-beta-curcumene cyclase
MLMLLIVGCRPAAAEPGEAPGLYASNISLKLEIQHAIDQGIGWLAGQQHAEIGSWSETDHPALSALAVAAIMGNPSRQPQDPVPATAVRGYAFLAGKAKADGGIYGKGLAVYNTALSLTALLLNPGEEYATLKLEARRFLINQQSDFDIRGEADNPYDGGVGYGGTYAHSDLSNTHLALEALYYSKVLVADSGGERDRRMDLDWDAAIRFVSRTQNLPASSGEWASDDPRNRGGFVYFPGDSKAGKEELPGGRVALRSYGSMSYAGLLSFVYAGMERDDPRVVAVLDWLRRNYSVDENPGMGAEGRYYYYHTMAKALAICGIEEFRLEDGRIVDWRRDLAARLLSEQAADGSWVNANGRWWENDPVLVTAYSLLALEHIYRCL